MAPNSRPSSSKHQYQSSPSHTAYDDDDSLAPYHSSGDEEEPEDEEEEEEELDDDLDSDNDNQDGILPSPSRRTPRGRADSEGATNLFGSPTRSKRGTPKKKPGVSAGKRRRNWIEAALDPTTPGWVKPCAADAYFLAASRPKRRKVEVEVEQDEEEGGKLGGGKGLIGAKTSGGTSREERQAALGEHYKILYPNWSALLLKGFNLLLSGYGSKRALLSSFLSTLAPLGHCMVIDGLYPGLGIKEVLIEIEESFPGVKGCPSEAVGVVERIAERVYAYFLPPEALRREDTFPTSGQRLFLVINNIDSPLLRTPKSLAILALLASSPRIHLIASFDHPNTPILFSSTLTASPPHTYPSGSWSGTPNPSRGFCWAYLDTPTYAPYTLESTYVSQSRGLKAGDEGAMQITEEGTLRILSSVPPHSRRLFKLLATLQLALHPPSTAHPLSAATQSAPAWATDAELLHQQAKRRMFAVEETRFEYMLGEYRDHGLVGEWTGERDGEGGRGRWLWVTLGREGLERVVETMGADEI